MGKQLPKVVVVCGPTATGKSDLAVELALACNGEVISADSRQVYRGLDIGSGKITRKEKRGVPHHLIDVADPKRAYTVENFKNAAEKAVANILSRGKLPIICGGTGFYVDALISGQEFPAVRPDQKLRTRLAKKPVEALMKEIWKLDSRRAKALDPHNKVRIIRAIEIARALGSVPRMKRKDRYETLFIGLTTSREKLRERIHIRLMKRMQGGKMVKEVARLQESGVSWKRLEALGLEYRYMALYLQNKLSKEEALDKLEWNIFHFSKRQMTWFKMNEKIAWISPGESKKAFNLAKAFLR